MKLFIALSSFLLAIHSIAGLECNGPHEYLYDYTPVCPLECGSLQLMRCLALINKPSCQCRDGTVRDNKNAKCVNLNECPKYFENTPSECNGENEESSEFVPVCPATCEHPTGPLCEAMIRRPSCVCSVGTVRDTVNGKCVAPERCPKKINSTQPLK